MNHRTILLALVALSGLLACQGPVTKDDLAPVVVEVAVPDAAVAPAPIVEEETLDDGWVEREALPEGFHFVVTTSVGTWVVLDEDAGEREGHGPLMFDAPADEDHPFAVRRAVEAERTDGTMVAYGSDGEVCRGELGEPWLLSRGTPPYEMWDGVEPIDPAELAAEMWNLGGERFVAARIDAECVGALWARDGLAASPVLFTEAEATRRLSRRALARFRALPEYVALQEEYENDELGEPWGTGRWETHDEGTSEVKAWTAEDGRRFVSVAASAGYGCGGFWGAVWAVFEVERGGSLALVAQGDDQQAPAHLADVEGDGVLEVHLGTAVSFERAGERTTVDFEVPYYDCPC